MELGETSPLFIDWARLGTDKEGAPLHVPTVEGDMIVCRCHLEGCQLDRALWRARVVGFMHALHMTDDNDVRAYLAQETA